MRSRFGRSFSSSRRACSGECAAARRTSKASFPASRTSGSSDSFNFASQGVASFWNCSSVSVTVGNYRHAPQRQEPTQPAPGTISVMRGRSSTRSLCPSTSAALLSLASVTDALEPSSDRSSEAWLGCRSKQDPNRIQTDERKWGHVGPCGSTSRRLNPFEINRESTWGHVGPDGGTKPVLVRNEKVAGSNPVGSTILGARVLMLPAQEVELHLPMRDSWIFNSSNSQSRLICVPSFRLVSSTPNSVGVNLHQFDSLRAIGQPRQTPLGSTVLSKSDRLNS